MTPKPQHTAGPWEIDKDPPNIGDGVERKFIQATHCKYISDGEEVVGAKDICHVRRNVFRMVPGEWEANAELIAAAPETAANCDHLIAMNKEINALNDKLQAEKAELVEAMKSIRCEVRKAIDTVSGMYGHTGDKLCGIITFIRNTAQSAIANTNEKQKETHSETSSPS